MEENLSNLVEEMVADFTKMVADFTKEEPQINEPPCVLWKADHPNCSGCPSELPCARMVTIMLIQTQSVMYIPKDFEDFQKTSRRVTELVGKVLKASTVEEVMSLI